VPHLRANKEDFYRFFVREVDSACVVINGSGDRGFKRISGSALRHQVETKLKDVRFLDSRSDPTVHPCSPRSADNRI
jgi:hypothetical protein